MDVITAHKDSALQSSRSKITWSSAHSRSMTGLPLVCRWLIHPLLHFLQTRLTTSSGRSTGHAVIRKSGPRSCSMVPGATKRLVIQHGQTSSRELAGPPQKMHSRHNEIPAVLRR